MEFNRLKRLRKNNSLRELFKENKLSIKNFILPFFVIEGKNKKEEIISMPGIYRFSVDNLLKEVEKIRNLGILSMILFGISEKKM